MPSLLQLTIGTEKVLPTMIKNSKSGSLKIQQLSIVNMRGVGVKQVTAVVNSASEPGKKYKTWMMFTGLTDPVKDKPTMKTNVFVRCGCSSFYFWAGYANKLHKSLAGRSMKPYTRVTPTSDPRYPPKNPHNIPLLCKHLIFMASELVRKRKIT